LARATTASPRTPRTTRPSRTADRTAPATSRPARTCRSPPPAPPRRDPKAEPPDAAPTYPTTTDLTGRKRDYCLATEYGMSGQDLAAKLRDLGFYQIKRHMTALSEFGGLEIQARREAYGIVGESAQQGAASVGGLKIKRKTKPAK